MKNLLLLLITVGFLIAFINASDAYLDCTPTNCQSGYENQSVICQGSTCTRTCVQSVCNTSTWTVVATNSGGWDLSQNNPLNIEGSTSGYTPPNKDKCYKFGFVAPPATSTNIDMIVIGDPDDCDTEGAAGFKAGTPPWFFGIELYTYYGNENSHSWDNYKLVPARGSADNIATTPYINNMATSGVIYCANNTVACDEFIMPPSIDTCRTGCYSESTIAHAHQGWLDITGGHDGTLHENMECTLSGITRNRYTPFYLNVSKADMYLVHNDQVCFRINEAPNATSVNIVPANPNAGQNLDCNFTYSDPEKFLEQNSTFEWWKNGVNQNINSKILDKGNLTVNDLWYCKVTPSDGLLFGTKVQSQNNVTILTTIKDPVFKIGSLTIWSKSGYYGHKEEILDFNQQLNDTLLSCVPDSQGFCDINLTFSSTATGILDLANLEIFYTTPAPPDVDIFLFNLTNLTSDSHDAILEFKILDVTPANYTWSINFGDGIIVNSTQTISLNASEDAFVITQHNYLSHEQSNMTNGLVAYWKLDDNKTTTEIIDSYINSHHGILSGGNTTRELSAGGYIKRSLNFDGTNDFVNVTHHTDFNFGTSGFSLTAWVKTADVGTGYHVIVGKRDSVQLWKLEADDGKASFVSNAIVNPTGVVIGTNINDGIWHHLVGVRENDGTLRIYVDGNLTNSTTFSQVNQNFAADVHIGKRTDVLSEYWGGLMDDVRVYNRSLSAGEVTELYSYRSKVYGVDVTVSNGTVVDTASLTLEVN